jgi:prepilin-type N-terminal cleavage/methylation domain-containing protein
MKKINFTKGYTLIEIIISITILTLIIGAIGAFQSNIFSLNRVIQVGISNQYEAKKIIKPFANEVRGAVPSETGSYAIENAGTSTFIFYGNIDSDEKIERVRYFLDGESFKKGIVKPEGNPVSYDQNNEQIIQVVQNIVPENIFEYYNSEYDGTASTSALVFPINPADVRLVKVKLQISNDQNNNAAPMSVETSVSIRNLKDNY